MPMKTLCDFGRKSSTRVAVCGRCTRNSPLIAERDTVARQLGHYLHGDLELSELVDWAEKVMQDGDFPPGEEDLLADVVGRLGLADVRAFGLTWEDCREMFRSLGVSAKVDLVTA
jgi:hypothetical protein